MAKVKITADAVLDIIKGVFSDSDIDETITDINAPFAWQGKTLQEVLNIEYYTFKHRPQSSEEIVAEKIREGGSAGINKLMALNRSFCLLSIGDIERLFSKDADMIVLNPVLEFWVQTSKVKILEDLIENANIECCGIRIPVEFGTEMRKAVMIFSGVNVVDVQTETACGEMIVCEVNVSLLLYPDVASYSDYEVKFEWLNDNDNIVVSPVIPLSSFSTVSTMTQKAIPLASKPSGVGSINLSKANSFVLVFDGYNNTFVDRIITMNYSDTAVKNNWFVIEIKRKSELFRKEVIIKDHQITVNADTGNELHTLSLVVKGGANGIT